MLTDFVGNDFTVICANIHSCPVFSFKESLSPSHPETFCEHSKSFRMENPRTTQMAQNLSGLMNSQSAALLEPNWEKISTNCVVSTAACAQCFALFCFFVANIKYNIVSFWGSYFNACLCALASQCISFISNYRMSIISEYIMSGLEKKLGNF